jgi:ferric enterobactin receptor
LREWFLNARWIGKPTLLTALLLLVWCTDAAAQIRVEGTVRWADRNPAVGVTVTLRDMKAQTVTDENGHYRFDNVRPGVRGALDVTLGKTVIGHAYTLLTLAVEKIDIELAGFVSDASGAPQRLALPPPVQTVIVQTSPRPQAQQSSTETGGGEPAPAGAQSAGVSRDGLPTIHEEVVVTASMPMLSTSTEAGKMTLSPEQVEVLPSLGTRDIFRALQLLPGVSANETSSGLSVRGGTPDQNLVSYDGFTIYSVDHLFGYFSAFNMDAVEAVDLSKGSYDARYGGRLSSLTEIRGKSNARDVKGMVGATLLNADGAIEFPLGSAASLLVAARQSYQTPLYDRILGLVNRNRNTPRAPAGNVGGRFASTLNSEPKSNFNDLNVRFDARPSSRDQFAFSLYNGDDGVDNSRELQLPTAFLERLASRGITFDGGFKITDVRDYGNLGASANWNHNWNERIKTTATLSRSTYDTLTDRSSNIGGRQGSTGEFNTIEDWTLRIDTPIRFSPSQELTLGLQRTTNQVRYGLQNAQGAPTGPFAGQPAVPLSSSLNRDTSGDLTSLYAQHRLIAGTRLIATPGVRVTRFSETGETAVEPRLSGTFLATPALRFKGAWGIYHQYVNRLVREDVLQGNRDFWALADGSTIPVSSSVNTSAGAAYETNRFLADVEVFSRDVRDISQLAPRVTGSTAGIDLSQFFYRGTGKARGLEVLAQRKAGRHTGWASYTLSRVTYDFPDLGARFVADHDRTHELKLVDTVQFDRWTLSGTWIVSTGTPYTEPVGTTATPIESPFGTLTVERIDVGEKNAARLPNYHRLDAAAHYTWPLGDGRRKGTIGVSVFNAYNRQNVWYKEFTVVEGEIVENNINLMSLTLNAFFTVKF